MKGIKIRKKERKLSLFVDDMILCTKIPKESTKTCQNKVAQYKINIQKIATFLYINNEISEREIQKTIPSTIASKKQNTKEQF